jgi:hypothetical protein
MKTISVGNGEITEKLRYRKGMLSQVDKERVN